MIFEDSSTDSLLYTHYPYSPDLRPITLPMSGHGKTIDGMINLQNVAISFPESNAFAQYSQQPYMPRMSDQYLVSGPYQEAEPDYYSDSDFGYQPEYNTKPLGHTNLVNQVSNAAVSANSGSQSASRKRKASASPEYVQPRPQKRAAVAQLHVQDPEYWELNPPFLALPPVRTANNSPRRGHHYSTSNASQISLTAPSPHTPAWSPSFTTVKTEHSPRDPMTPVARPASTSTPYSSAGIPRLIRTSTITQQCSPSLGGGSNAGAPTEAFNPYTMFSQYRASLQLKGDLDAVATEWSDEELKARRKLITFTRELNGCVIDADFQVVPQDAWQRGNITVNCIWWKEKKEAFVTSVDTIALLEYLVSVRFTVEEKNRIRRNLEGFRPLTVSKAKAESEDFFKVIMGFSNPKPRNIEKDVKVFPWKILAHALKKIIGKYSASYSSTASLLDTPSASVYGSTEHSSECQQAPSPNHDVVPHSMPSYSVPVTSYDQHVMHGRMSATVTSGPPDLSLQMPNMPQSFEVMHRYGYDVMPMTPYTMHAPQQAMTAPIHRPQPTWNFDAYASQEGTVSMQSASAPASAYPRSHGEATDFFISPTYHHHYHR